jgi:MFS family permease
MTVSRPIATEHADTLYQKLSSAIDQVPFKRTHTIIIVMIGFGALFDAIEQFNVGYAAPFLARQWGLSTTQVALLTTFTLGGLAVGSAIAGVTGDLYGRRVTYMYNLLLFSVGGLISAFAPNYEFLLVARLIVGIGLGGEMSTALTIMSEMMPTRVRGVALGFVNVAGGGVGIFVASALATVILGPLSAPLGGDDVAWRYLLGILVIPAIFVYYFRRYIPESPRYLVRTGRIAEVNRVLSQMASGRLRPVGDLAITRRIDGVEGQVFAREKTRMSEMFQGVLLRRTVVLWVMAVMTFGAQVAVTSLMPTILIAKGFDAGSSLQFALLINIGSLVGAIAAAAMGYLLPRRTTLCGGAIVAAIASAGFGFARSSGWVIVFGLLTALMFMLLNTTVWMYNPELYPTRLRGIGTGVGTTVGLCSAALFPLAAAALLDGTGSVGLFLVVAGMYVVMAAVSLFGPETRGRSLEQISELDDSPERVDARG